MRDEVVHDFMRADVFFWGGGWLTNTDVILGSVRRTLTGKIGSCLIRLYVLCAGSFLPVTVEEPATRSANDRPIRSTPWD